MRDSYKIFVDTGGTFTDCIGLLPNGEVIYKKVLSSGRLRGKIEKWISETEVVIDESWDVEQDSIIGCNFAFTTEHSSEHKVTGYDAANKILKIDTAANENCRESAIAFEVWTGEEAPVLGIRMITRTPPGKAFPQMEVRLGTTKGTNALLEKRGADTVLITTSGYRDILRIGNQQRPDIFSKEISKPEPLAGEVVEAREQIDSTGNRVAPIDTKALEKDLLLINNKDNKSVAICLMNAYVNSSNERVAAAVARKLGFGHISVSSELSSMIKLLDRTETTVVNSYLAPVIRNYLDEINAQLGAANLRIMTSAGGLVKDTYFKPMDSLLSGPAGGVVGASLKGKYLDESHLITFDMGGTSTDVSRYDGEFDYLYEHKVGDARIMAPALHIETVAAGGGSVCGFDGYRLFVGPESAGAFPGPACYGAGGPLTLTDVNLLAGKLHPDNFTIPIYPEASDAALESLVVAIEKESGTKPSNSDLIESFLAIANEIMAGAIKKISVLKGYDPSEYSLVSFGGAGGLHACSLAGLLGIKKIILPEEAGLLSAYGIGQARIERFAEKQILKPLESLEGKLDGLMRDLELETIENLLLEGFTMEKIEIRSRKIFLRYKGQDNSLAVEYENENSLREIFKRNYLSVYGHTAGNREIEIEAVRVVASDSIEFEDPLPLPKKTSKPEPYVYNDRNIAVYKTEMLEPGCVIEGPALLLDHFSTTYIEDRWTYMMHWNRTGIITVQENRKVSKTGRPYEAQLELFTNRFMSIAENMGAMLQRTAFSVNIKDRLDFSCALLDAEGNLVANAPHIPVHLGGLSVCVKTLLERMSFKPGDVVVTNHPGFGGSHLPDVTTVSPVFAGEEKLVAFVVNRAHHSEIGGISPGSMPPSAKNLIEEGVVISPFLLVENGIANWKGMHEILTTAPFPTRNPEENMADLNAALAANKKGTDALLEMVGTFGMTEVSDFFNALRRHAAERMRITLRKIENGTYSALETLDDGSNINVKITKESEHCIIDFTGSAPVHPLNMNATRAIGNSVVIYVLRLLLNEPIPLNDGLLEPVEIIVPEGMLNPDFPDDPADCPAVVGGNVEISQRITDTLLKAFGTMAASQGTMNNVLFGNNSFGYYETLAGGTGAGAGFHGADAVHHHMTNTRITDPEVIEHRYPVRIVETSIRKGSGGSGKWKGGEGMKRIYEFRESVNLSLLTQRRQSGPYGLAGGEAGQKGEQYIVKPDGTRRILGGTENIQLDPGDRLEIVTPGGGGYGLKCE